MRVIAKLPGDWFMDGSATGYGSRYSERVRQTFDEGLERLAEANQVDLYRKGEEIWGEANFEGWSNEIRDYLLNNAHSSAESQALADPE